jgi:hypothetical protein
VCPFLFHCLSILVRCRALCLLISPFSFEEFNGISKKVRAMKWTTLLIAGLAYLIEKMNTARAGWMPSFHQNEWILSLM